MLYLPTSSVFNIDNPSTFEVLKQENQKPRVIFGYTLCSKHSKYTFPNGDWELKRKIIVGMGEEGKLEECDFK